MYNSSNSEVQNSTNYNFEYVTSQNLALGFAAGQKYVSKSGIIAEYFLGIGRNLFNTENKVDFVGRFGASIGFRF